MPAFTCLGHNPQIYPICVTSPKMSKASTAVTLACHSCSDIFALMFANANRAYCVYAYDPNKLPHNFASKEGKHNENFLCQLVPVTDGFQLSILKSLADSCSNCRSQNMKFI